MDSYADSGKAAWFWGLDQLILYKHMAHYWMEFQRQPLGRLHCNAPPFEKRKTPCASSRRPPRSPRPTAGVGIRTLQLHLLELRLRAAYLLFSLVGSFLICTLYSVQLMYLICAPFSAAGGHSRFSFIFTDLTEGLYTTVHLSLAISLFLSIPVLIYQCWCFFMPSCYLRERQLVSAFLLAIALFLFISIFLAYSWILPQIAIFLQQFQLESKCMEIRLEARIAPAVGWSFTSALVVALLFQVPPLFGLLIYTGFVNANLMRINRRYALFSLLLMASLVSPPDVWSQLVCACAGCVLYEWLHWCALFCGKWGE